MRTTLILKRFALVMAAFLGTAACGQSVDEGPSLELVATTSILGDITSNVIGGAADLTTIMPPGADPHEFEPSAQQVAAIRSADLIIANGLHLEESLEDVLEAAVQDGAVLLEIGPAVDPLPLDESSGFDTHESEGFDTHESDGFDPHVWLDPIRMVSALDEIAAALTELDASVDWTAGASSYAEELLNLDRWIKEQLESIPPSSRVLFTGHQAFGYFAARYDFEVVATILPGASTMIEPSASSFAEVAEVLEESSAPAIFTDIAESQALAEQLAGQVERTVEVVPLYLGGLGLEGSGAETYVDLMRWNVEAIRLVFEQ